MTLSESAAICEAIIKTWGSGKPWTAPAPRVFDSSSISTLSSCSLCENGFDVARRKCCVCEVGRERARRYRESLKMDREQGERARVAGVRKEREPERLGRLLWERTGP